MLFPFLLMIDLYFFIPVVNTQIFNPTAKLAIPTRTLSTNEANAKIAAHPLTAEKMFKVI